MRRSEWKKQRRKEYLEQRNNVYIFCEGEKTEPLYFQELKKAIEKNAMYQNMIHIDIQPCATNTVQVVEKAFTYIERNQVTHGEVWCVYDLDDFPKENFDRANQMMVQRDGRSSNLRFKAAWSNQCFELWYVLHFDYYNVNNNRDQYSERLTRKLRSLNKGIYTKTRPDMFEILNEVGNPKNAIKFSKKLLENKEGRRPSQIAPATKVYELVENLAKYLPDDIKVKFLDETEQ